jgi:ribosomal protein S18 acetylase RimI-like enzyme
MPEPLLPEAAGLSRARRVPGARAELAERALAWTHRGQEQVCDRIEPWEHGTVYRSTRYPRYFSANLVTVKDDPALSVLRGEFAARGFQSTRLVWMHFDGPPAAPPEVPVIQVPYDAVEQDEVEIGAVYVSPGYRGQGRGTALTQATIRAAGGVTHVWISADDEDRPKHLYARLGFRPVVKTTELWRA